MNRVQSVPKFDRAYKKLKPNQREAVDKAIRVLIDNPDVGENKKGDLNGIRVYKFSMVGQKALIGYTYIEGEFVVILLAVGPHENFYRDLKK